jgi:alpha,alpha-trehalose phosphorylase
MARFNLRYAAATVRWLKATPARSDAFDALLRRTGLDLAEVDRWEQAAEAMHLPFDQRLGINPQDEVFLELERWDFEGTPDSQYPLLLHFHPLVIYRHQVLKQADVVLAMFLQGEHFDLDQKRRNFDYYDPITTGDSSLSACVQSIVASEVGAAERAWLYFQHSLYLDLCDTHGNTVDGVHIANAGGAWAAVVSGFAGLREGVDGISFRPSLPSAWDGYSFRLCRGSSVLNVAVDKTGAELTLVSGEAVSVVLDGTVHTVQPDSPVQIPSSPDQPQD